MREKNLVRSREINNQNLVILDLNIIFAAEMYEQYLKYDSIPAGSILQRILRKEHISQKKLSDQTGIITQRINDLVKGKRRFTVESSALLARFLPVPDPGYFYRIQCNHDIYTYIERYMRQPVECSLFREALFWDIDATTLDWKKHKCWIIQRVFEYGNESEVKVIIEHYGSQAVTDALNNIQDDWKRDARERMTNKFLK